MIRMRSLLGWLLLVLLSVLVGGTTGLVIYSFWDLPAVHSLEEFRPSITSRVLAGDGSVLAEFYIENRTPVDLAEIPPVFLQALLAIEDRRFYDHHGIDVFGIARALVRNIRAGAIREGGSTLTQQLAKVLFLTPERSYTRKLKEIALALRIEQRYTKSEILSLYCNQIYFGSGAYGVESAAQIYFGKSARDLTLADSALLAGLPRSPKHYSPYRDQANARNRRATVLGRMAALGFITAAQASDAAASPLPLVRPPASGGPAPYFVEYVRQKVEEQLGSGILYTGGLTIETSIDLRLQEAAERALTTGLARIVASQKKRQDAALQGAVVVLDPGTGRILAMVGGRDYHESQFNRAWQAYRQPGSAFKPFIYAAALDRGIGAADLLDGSPLTVALDRNSVWRPENFSRRFHGPVTLRSALVWSLNVPTVRLFQKVGAGEIIRLARRLGISSQLQPVPALALGSSDVSLLELTSAYSAFAAQGVRVPPGAIQRVTDSTGRTLYNSDGVPEQVLKPETAFLTTHLLRGVIERGTASRALALKRPAAGKTGTTNEYRDAWFIGFVPGLTAGVWIGYDDYRPIGLHETGARAALPVWIELMRTALAGTPPEEFPAPPSIIFRQIDPRTGLLSTEKCLNTVREAFLPGTEPRRFCDESIRSAEDVPEQDETTQDY